MNKSLYLVFDALLVTILLIWGTGLTCLVGLLIANVLIHWWLIFFIPPLIVIIGAFAFIIYVLITTHKGEN